MKLSLAWLRELVELKASDEEIIERLTLLGLEVEEVVDFRLEWPNVVVGEVLEATQHPNADRLRVCRVHNGVEEVQIVCGASNVRTGLKIALANPGAVLPGDFKIKKGKIRGEVSLGMICSEKELGLGQGHEGILELPEDAPVGKALDELYGCADKRIEIEVTPNRPDWLSHIGVARELAAFYGGKLRLPELPAERQLVESDQDFHVEIQDAEGCPRFSAQLMDGASVGPSPLWLRQRLLAIGQRPINCVVDVSNFVLHECGHPNHVFDRSKLRDHKLVIRSAKSGEKFTTLDDQERTLEGGEVLVCDGKAPVALAGVMGGANSEVEDSTTSLLVEVALFDPKRIRKARRGQQMSTDASYRFERGVDPATVEWAQRRLAQLLEEVAGAKGEGRLIDARGVDLPQPAKFHVRASQARRLLGVEFSPAEMETRLGSLGIDAKAKGEGVDVLAPSFRPDLLEEVDALEELARLHGFDRLPEPERLPMLKPAERATGELLHRRLRETFASLRFHETLATNFMPEDDPDRLRLAADDRRRQSLAVLNPIVQGEASLRTNAVGGMLRIADLNRRHGHSGPIRIFQVGRTFLSIEGERLAEESEELVILWEGARESLHPAASSAGVECSDVVGEISAALGHAGFAVATRPGRGSGYHRPGTAIQFTVGEKLVGQAGEVSAPVLEAFGLAGPCWIGEFPLRDLLDAEGGDRIFRAYSAYPPVRRDLSLVVSREVGYHQIEAMVQDQLKGILEEVGLFDLYEGEGLEAGTRALGLRLVLRSGSGTLKDKKVEAMIQRLLKELEKEHGITLRG